LTPTHAYGRTGRKPALLLRYEDPLQYSTRARIPISEPFPGSFRNRESHSACIEPLRTLPQTRRVSVKRLQTRRGHTRIRRVCFSLSIFVPWSITRPPAHPAMNELVAWVAVFYRNVPRSV